MKNGTIINYLKIENDKLKEEVAKLIKDKEEEDVNTLKRASIGGAIINIIHQLRQPLSEISLITEAMKMLRGENSNQEQEKMFVQIQESIKYMSNTISLFVDYENKESTKKEAYINEEIELAINLSKELNKKEDIDINYINNNEGAVVIIPTSITQVIMNILNNARQVLSERKVKGANIQINSYIKEKQNVIEIQDNAGGLKEEELNKIFDEKYSNSEKEDSMGIGLKVVKKIVKEQINGKISVKNNQNGLIFTIKF